MHCFKIQTLLVVLITFHVGGTTLHAAQQEPHTALQKHAGFTITDLRDVEQGKVITKVLETDNKNEVAVVGAVWIEAPIDDFVAWQKDIERFKTGDAVLGIQRISRPPRLADFQTLTPAPKR